MYIYIYINIYQHVLKYIIQYVFWTDFNETIYSGNPEALQKPDCEM